MRVVYFGSGTFSIPSLRAILASGHEVAGIVTQPARPAGRGGKVRPTPVAEAARQDGCDVTECGDVNAEGCLGLLGQLKGDVICVVDFGQFIGPQVIRAVPMGAFNLHASLLPELRGAAPINWALIRGYQRTGVTTFQIVRQMDAGRILLQAPTDIGPEETAAQLRERLAGTGAQLVCRTLDLLAEGRAAGTEQDPERATFAPRLKKSDGILDWSADARSLCNRIRGTWPWPGGQAVFCHDERKVPVAIGSAVAADGPPGAEPGSLDSDLLVGTGSGRIGIRKVRPSGRRLMDWRDFVNGYRVRAGDRFLRADR